MSPCLIPSVRCFFFALVILLAGTFFASAESLQLTPEEQAWLRAHPVVRARISPTYPPFEFFDNGTFQGMAYDYVQLIAGRLGIRIVPVTDISWKEALEQLKSRNGVDLVVLITRDKERESFIEFTRDYISFPEVIFTRKDSQFVSGVKDLCSKTIATENSFIEIDYLKRDIPQVKLIETKTTEEALADVATGKADAYLGNLAVASYLIERNGLVDLKVAAPSPYPDDSYAMGVRKDWPELARIFDKVLAAMSEEEHRQIRQKWLSLRYEHGLRPLDVVKWVAIVAGVLFVFICQLRRMVRQRTAELQQSLRKLEDVHRKLADIIEFLPDATFVLDREGRVLAWNRAIEEMTGVGKKEMIGKGDQAYAIPFYGTARPVLADMVMKAGGLTAYRYESFERRGDILSAVGFTPCLHGGAGAHIAATASPLYDHAGNLVGAIESLRDVTVIKQAEATVQQLNANLEQRVAARTEELAVANETLATEIEQRRQAQEEIAWLNEDLMRQKAALEAANHELESFSYSVSHDLRAPLRHMQGFLSMLLDDHGACLPAQAVAHIERAQKAGERMNGLIDGLLNLARLSSSPIQAVPLDLSAIAREIGDGLQQAEPGRQVTFVVEDGLQVYADPVLMRAVLENLLGNSWKFSARREGASIAVGRETVDGLPAYFVRDNGAGFDMAHANRLFGPFQRLHDSTEFTGSGIGLATVQRIILRHGGRIWAEAQPGHGATFYFTLPH